MAEMFSALSAVFLFGRAFDLFLCAFGCSLFGHLFGTLQAEPLLSLFLSGQETEKEAVQKSVLTFEVAVVPTLGLVIPVYRCQTGF